ncbi:unnamed protein product, partial [Allacma fusca]
MEWDLVFHFMGFCNILQEDHGAPGICDGLLYSVTTITYHNCTRPAMASIPAMPRDWYEKVLADAVHKCDQTRVGPGTTAKPKLTTVAPGAGAGPDKVIAGKHYFGRQEKTEQSRFYCYFSEHPNYNDPNNSYGYGLIHLSEPFILNENVNFVRAASIGDVPSNGCFMIGWQGTSADTELREQPVTFEDPSHCEDAHPTVSCVEGGACLV